MTNKVKSIFKYIVAFGAIGLFLYTLVGCRVNVLVDGDSTYALIEGVMMDNKVYVKKSYI